MESRRCCDRYAQDETANLTYMCSYGYTVPMHQISSLEPHFSGGANRVLHLAMEMRPKKPDIVTKNRTLSHAPPGHLCGDILCWAEARSRELPPGHAYRPHFEVGRHGNMATPRLQRVAPGRDLHTWSTLSSQGQLSKGSEAILAFIGEQSSHYHSFWGKLIRGQKTYKAKNSAVAR